MGYLQGCALAVESALVEGKDIKTGLEFSGECRSVSWSFESIRPWSHLPQNVWVSFGASTQRPFQVKHSSQFPTGRSEHIRRKPRFALCLTPDTTVIWVL